MASLNESRFAGQSAWAGLDISDTHAYWVVMVRRGAHWQVQDCQQWPLQAGWLENGRILDFQNLADALQQYLAGNQILDLAMALPPEACASCVVEPPRGLLHWGRRRWMAARAAELMQRPVSDLSWSAHELPGPARRWRLMAAGLEQIQDWLGLAEAIGCNCLFLDEAHQAAWRALDRWQVTPPEGAWLFQVGTACIQALHEQSQRWRWAWRDQGQAQSLIDRCLASATGAPVFVLGHSPLAQALQQAFSVAGVSQLQPEPCDRLKWAPDLFVDRRFQGYWTALGLADRQGIR